jgi:AcrR family transcriptional regulator
VENASAIFNEKGLDITLDAISREMGITKGLITNHFPTKESLFQAIMGFYEWQLGEYIRHYKWEERILCMESIALFISGIMNIQYENRCAISYLAIVSREKRETFEYIQNSYKQNVEMIRTRIRSMVKAGILDSLILKNKVFSVFLFQYTNLMTHWVVSVQHYGGEMGYPSLKPIYLEGILQCYFPYLSPTGMDQYKNLNFSKLAKSS